MKKLIIFLVVLVVYNSQGQSQPPKLDELNIPSSPAFVLLDQSPASIEKPTNPKAFAISLLNVANNGGAIETTPYWLVNHANYTFDNDIKNHFPFLQTFAISLASIKKTDTTNLSIGFRTQLFRKYFNEKEIFDKEKTIQGILVTSPIDTIALKSEKNKLSEMRSGRVKYNLELAGAYLGKGLNYKDLSSSKFGVWMNFRYTPANNSFFDIVALARYSKVISSLINQVSDSSFLDFGGSLSKQGKNYDVQLEYVYRRDTTLNTSYDRIAFIANYQLSPGIVAVASLGKNYNNENDIFTVFGVKFGLSGRNNNK